MAGKQLVVAAESRAALWMGVDFSLSHLLQSRSGNWNLTCLMLPLLFLFVDFNVVLLKGELMNEVFVLNRVLSGVAMLH